MGISNSLAKWKGGQDNAEYQKQLTREYATCVYMAVLCETVSAVTGKKASIAASETLNRRSTAATRQARRVCRRQCATTRAPISGRQILDFVGQLCAKRQAPAASAALAVAVLRQQYEKR